METRFVRSKQLCLAIAIGCSTTSTYGYEVGTHEILSKLAVERSVLADGTSGPLLALGVEEAGATFASLPPVGEESRRATALRLVELGARYEDHLLEVRPLRHFFDPQQGGIGLTLPPPIGSWPASPDWTLEDEGDDPAQAFSLSDAVDMYKFALTFQTKDFRDDSLIELMQTIGRGIHHMQDMAQPAHTRNDQHLPLVDGDTYETYTEQQFVEQRRPIPFAEIYGPDGLDLTRFASARDFWFGQSAGIAEFSSNNFVSKDTNFRYGLSGVATDPLHPLPVPGALEQQTLQQLGVHNPWIPNAVVTFVGNTVTDGYANTTEHNARTSTLSIFAPLLGTVQLPASVSLNPYNFEARYSMLFSRAIAYSTGLINYFFRGRLMVENLTVSGSTMQLTIKNTSAGNLAMAESTLLPEEFSVYYDAADGSRKRLPLTGDDLSGASFAHEATRTLSFPRPLDLDVAKGMPFVLVFDGTIGSERGIAALSFGDGGGSILVTPNYTPADGIAGPRVIRWNGSRWVLTTETGKVAGGVDWKGRDAGDVLSWGGALARYFNPSGGPVHKDGRILTTGPAGVGGSIIGASIRKIDGVRVLNVVKLSGTTLSVYSRLYADQYPNEAPWSEVNPLGWRQVYVGTQGDAFTPFFFNQSGTEGQYITRESAFRPVRRVKLTLAGYTASIATYPAIATVRRSIANGTKRSPSFHISHGTCSASGAVVADPSDSCRKISYVGRKVEDSHTRTIEQFADRTILCVDYQGDREVFCELLPPDDDQPLSDTDQTETVLDYYDRLGSSCGTERQIHTYRTSSFETQFSRRYLKVGDAKVSWAGSLTTITSARQHSGDALVANSFSGSKTFRTDGKGFSRGKILHLDARHDLIVYQIKESTSLTTSASEFQGANGNGIGATWQGNTSQFSNPVYRVVAHSRGVESLLFEHENSTLTETPVNEPTGSLRPSPGKCNDNPFASDPHTPTTLLDPLASSDYISTDGSGRFAIASDGKLAAAPFVFVTSVGGPTENGGYWLHLDGGDLATLIPSAGPVSSRQYTFKVLQ